MDTCPYCGKLSVVSKHRVENVRTPKGDFRVSGALLECQNPDCPEPHRYSPEQLRDLECQLVAQGAF